MPAPARPKTSVWCPTDLVSMPEDPLDRGLLRFREPGIILLGAPLGSPQFIREALEQKMEKVREITSLLPFIDHWTKEQKAIVLRGIQTNTCSGGSSAPSSPSESGSEASEPDIAKLADRGLAAAVMHSYFDVKPQTATVRTAGYGFNILIPTISQEGQLKKLAHGIKFIGQGQSVLTDCPRPVPDKGSR